VTTVAAGQQNVTPAVSKWWRNWRWVLLAVIAIVAISALASYLTTPRPGGQMDPEATTPDGAHALVDLLRQAGVDVVVAKTVADVERDARSDSLLLVAQTSYTGDDEMLQRLARTPGDRLLVEPLSTTRAALAPQIRRAHTQSIGGEPNCPLREADRSGRAELAFSDRYEASGDLPITTCYDGAVVRYRDDDRTITVVGTADFMTNGGLLKEGNAALAMNLAGDRARLIWYAPQQAEGQTHKASTIFELIPSNMIWMVWQLVLVVALVALWRGRRMGPLVAENLPVVVRASETVEGRGRLYRSRRARDRAADALRTAALQRMLPRLGLAISAAPPAVVAAVASRSDRSADFVQHVLYGPAPATDADLVNLARELDNIERQVAQS
jgi:Domain of unknown function (DUF4350)